MPGTSDADTSQRPKCIIVGSQPSSQDSQTAPWLSLDIFRLILEHLPRADLLTLTYASRFVREEATKELLMRPVTLRRREQVQSFCKFALSGRPARLSCLRTLTLRRICGPLDENEKDAIAAVLHSCTNLTDLRLHPCDCLLWQNSRIPQAIASLPSLKTLSVGFLWGGWGVSAVLAVLHRMVATKKHSPLRAFSFEPLLKGGALPALLQGLASVHCGLEQLSIAAQKYMAPAGVSFPHVHTLRLAYTTTLPRLADLHATYPNVRDLRLLRHWSHMPHFLQDLCPEPPGDVQRSQRAIWPSLDSLAAPPNVICTLGLFWPVRTLDISLYEFGLFDRIAAIVSRLRPRKLLLSLRLCGNYDRKWTTTPIPPTEPGLLLYNSGEAGVKHLLVRITKYDPMHPPKTANVLETIFPFLWSSHVELVHLALGRHVSFSFDPDDAPVAVGPGCTVKPVRIPEPSLQVHLVAVARAVAEFCPSLRFIAVTTEGVGPTIWRINRTCWGVEVVKLDLDEGKRLLEQEAKRCLED
ncbi:hypothetical protein OH77DRAFT_1421588 [Trametes cingulata]|nr:hypothetical protein OH77DRAFT_1421588 [Trametes cingulata]